MIRALLLAGVLTVAATRAAGVPQPRRPGERAPQASRIDTVFAEGFESGSFAAWDDHGRPARQQIVTDPSFAATGSRYLQANYPQGDDAGWLSKFFMPGYESLYVRLSVRFPPDWVGGTKLISFYGSRIDDRWSGAGKAGRCPTGTDFFVTTLVVRRDGDPGPVRFYTYYPAMPRERDGVTCYGAAGERVATYHAPAVTLSRDQWHRIEFWVRLNAPGESNSLQRFWVDGQLAGEWSGISLRNTTDLRLNVVTITLSAVSPRAQRLYADDVLVARQIPR